MSEAGRCKSRMKILQIMYNILIISYIYLNIQANAFDLQTMTNITIDVVRKYNMACVYLLDSNQRQGSLSVAIMKSILSETAVYVSSKPIQDVTNSPYWENNLPLYVISIIENHTSNPLAQLSKSRRLSNGRWLIYLDKMSPKEIFDDIPFDGHILAAHMSTGFSEEDPGVSITEVYRVHHTLQLQENVIAHWNSARGMIWSANSLYRRADLTGVVLRCVAVPEPPFVAVDKRVGEDSMNVTGYVIELWKLLQDLMKFTSEYGAADASSYGTQHANGSWNGMVGDILYRDFDIGLNFLMITKQRDAVVDYFPPIFNTKMMVYIRKPDKEHSTIGNILQQFSPKMWMIAFITMVVLSTFLSFTWCAEIYYNNRQDAICYKPRDSWFNVCASVTQQSQLFLPRSWPCRLVYLTLYLLTLVLFISYSAIFISFLAVNRSHLPFTNFKQILNDGTYKLGVPNNSERKSYFEKSNDIVMREVYGKIIRPYDKKPLQDDDSGLMRTCNEEKYSYFCSQITVRALEKSLPCTVAEIPQAYFSTTVSMIIKKYSPYKRLFSRHIQNMKRAGILKRLDAKIWFKNLDESKESQPRVSLNMVHIFFMILLLGASLSLLILFLEIGLQRLSTRKRKREENYVMYE